jgi:hypothetical protein
MSVEPKTVLLYAMGGVAAPSIKHSLRRASPSLNIVQAHVLNFIHAMELRAAQRMAGWRGAFKPKAIRAQLEELREPPSRIKILSIVADPIETNIVSYYQSLDLIFNRNNAYESLSLDELTAGFFSRYLHAFPLTWFDKELHQTMGIDIYSYPFPAKKKALSLTKEGIDFLVVRKDLDDLEKQVLIESFLDIRGLVLDHQNAPVPHPDPEKFRAFVSQLELPSSYIEQMLCSKYTRHFFSATEIGALKNKWCSNSRQAV